MHIYAPWHLRPVPLFKLKLYLIYMFNGNAEGVDRPNAGKDCSGEIK